MLLSKEYQRYQRLLRTVGAYRLVLGQPRQEDLLRYLSGSAGDLSWMRMDLTPPPAGGLFADHEGHGRIPSGRAEPVERGEAADTRTTAQRGIDLVMRELRARGLRAQQVEDARRNEVAVGGPSHPSYILRVKTRSAGTWQVSTNDGDPDPPHDDSRVVVFVDLAGREPDYYLVPEWWYQEDVYREHSGYLACLSGPRPSTHHAIPVKRIQRWRGRWDLLGVD
jgi:hypothetical protein